MQMICKKLIQQNSWYLKGVQEIIKEHLKNSNLKKSLNEFQMSSQEAS